MFGWLIRILFVLASFITSFFVAKDALNYNFVQMVIVVILFTLMVAIIAFWPLLKSWFKK